jgi:DNA polymerase III alpha subunit (gram-positive type)
MAKCYLPFDTETGGLNCEKVDVLTIYISVLDENFKLLDELDLKLKPDDRLPIAEDGALKVNGINLLAHMNDPETITYSAAKEKIIYMLKKHLKKQGRYSNLRPMGHNIPFDLNFIWKHLIPKDEWDQIVHYGLVDTKPVADFLKDCGWLPQEIGTLGSLVDYLGIPKRNAHAAKDDTLMCVDVYKKLLEMMKEKKENSGKQDLISLLEAE